MPKFCFCVHSPVLFAGARTQTAHPGEAGHSGPELEEQNQQPGKPQRYHRAQYVAQTAAVIETSTFKHTQSLFFCLKSVSIFYLDSCFHQTRSAALTLGLIFIEQYLKLHLRLWKKYR